MADHRTTLKMVVRQNRTAPAKSLACCGKARTASIHKAGERMDCDGASNCG